MTKEKTENELAPCPFCGNKVNDYGNYCECDYCEFMFGSKVVCYGGSLESTFDSESEFRESWNKRHKEPVDSGCDCRIVCEHHTHGYITLHKSDLIGKDRKFVKIIVMNHNLEKYCHKCGTSLKPFYDALMEVE